MAFSSMFALSSLVILPVLIAQWVGIVGLRHGGRNGSWWLMASGVMLSSLGSIASIGWMILMAAMPRGGSMDYWAVVILIASGLSGLGSLLFAIGFAMHGLRSSRAANRMMELEQLTAAMAEEVGRLRQGGPAA